jgi:hypothetical protein
MHTGPVQPSRGALWKGAVCTGWLPLYFWENGNINNNLFSEVITGKKGISNFLMGNICMIFSMENCFTIGHLNSH